MGRSQLQGTPWHYTYEPSNSNSKNCSFNSNNKCTCKISSNHNKPCVGKSECEEFERKSRRVGPDRKISVKSKATPVTANNKKSHNRSVCVESGSKVIVRCQKTNESIEIRVTDKDNPFYHKEINDIVSIKGDKYKIVKIIK